jgi:hypothetical protein
MRLRDFILQNYDGNNAAFGRANDMSRTVVGMMVKKGVYYIYDGKLMIARKSIK